MDKRHKLALAAAIWLLGTVGDLGARVFERYPGSAPPWHSRDAVGLYSAPVDYHRGTARLEAYTMRGDAMARLERWARRTGLAWKSGGDGGLQHAWAADERLLYRFLVTDLPAGGARVFVIRQSMNDYRRSRENPPPAHNRIAVRPPAGAEVRHALGIGGDGLFLEQWRIPARASRIERYYRESLAAEGWRALPGSGGLVFARRGELLALGVKNAGPEDGCVLTLAHKRTDAGMP